MIRFSEPAFLLLLASLPWFWRVSRTARAGSPAAARICRVIVVVLVVLAAAGLSVRAGEGPATVMFVVDRSASMSAAARSDSLAFLNRATAAMRPGDLFGVVAFGADAALDRRGRTRAEVRDIPSVVDASATDIARALRVARLALPRGGTRRIVLISDGRATRGDAAREAALAAADDLPIDVWPSGAEHAEGRPAAVVAVHAPEDVRVAEPFAVSVEVEGTPGARERLVFRRNGDPPVERALVLDNNGTALASFTERRLQAGIDTYRATVRGRDPGTASDAGAGAAVTVSGDAAVLYVSSSRGALAPLLARSGFRVSRVGPDRVPTSAAALAAFDAVVLDDVPAEALGERRAAAIAEYVEQTGGGLLLLGSPRSLGVDGYPAGPMGRVMPIDLRPRAGRRAPSMAFVLVFDKSGSMADETGGVPKIELARQAVMRVMAEMPSSDAFGAIAFDASPVVVAPLEAARATEAIDARLRALLPGGSTSIAPAVEVALGWLRSADVAHRHLLLVSDGRTSPADADRLRTALSGRPVEVSVVAIGADADRELFEQLARDSGGRAYFPEDARELPLIAAREAARSAGGRTVDERFTIQALPHPVLAGLDLAALPRMGGYVVGAAKPTAEAVLRSHLGDPVLCAWRSGLGRVAVFTADLASPWSDGFRSWTGFGALWAQSLRWIARPAGRGDLRVAWLETDNGARVTVEAEGPDGRFRLFSDVRATVHAPDGTERDVELRASAPGRYEAPIPASVPGPHILAISARGDAGEPEARALRGFYWNAVQERRSDGIDMPGLLRLSQISGGTRLTPDAGPFDRPRQAEFHDLRPPLLLLALAAFLLDVALRRGLSLERIRLWGAQRQAAAAPVGERPT